MIVDNYEQFQGSDLSEPLKMQKGLYCSAFCRFTNIIRYNAFCLRYDSPIIRIASV